MFTLGNFYITYTYKTQIPMAHSLIELVRNKNGVNETLFILENDEKLKF